MFIQYFALILIYLSLTLIISLFCLGLRAITDVGMIGYPIRLFFQKHMPFWGKPIVLCSTCMSSFWGTAISTTLFFALSLQASFILFLMWVGSTISAAFINAIFWEAYQSFLKTSWYVGTCRSHGSFNIFNCFIVFNYLWSGFFRCDAINKVNKKH